jgi:FkbM family methyltransferase
LIDELGLVKIDLLLADIQGAEVAMLEGMQKSLMLGKVRNLIVSTHDGCISGDFATHQRCIQWIKEKNGHIIAEHTVEESFSGDGMIAASFHEKERIKVTISYNRAEHSLFGSPWARISSMLEQPAQPAPLSTTVAAIPDESSRSVQEVRSLKQQVKHCRIVVNRRLRNESKPKSWWLRHALSVRKLRRYLEQRSQEMTCLARLHRLRKTKKTELILGLHGMFELLSDDEIVSRSMIQHLSWDMRAIRQVVNLVQQHTGKSLRASTLLDIGANIGMVGLQMLSTGRMKRCVAFEPDPTNFALLWSNVRINGLEDSYDLHPVALGSRSRTCIFELSPTNCGDHRVRAQVPSGTGDLYDESTRGTTTVQMRDLDGIIDRCPGDFVRKIGLCWMDVQGFEAEVIRGGMRHLRAHAWPTVMEFWPYGLIRAGMDACELMNLLSPIWTRFTVLEHGSEPSWKSLDEIELLWQGVGTSGDFVNLLLVR